MDDVLIVGGGLNGCTLALALHGAGVSVTLIDALPASTHKDPGFDGRSYALSAASQKVLSQLDIWPALAPHAQPMWDIIVTDGRVGEGPASTFLHFDHAEIGNEAMGYVVEDRHLRNALQSAVQAAGFRHLTGTKVTKQTIVPGGVQVTANGQTYQGQLLIGSDGRGSGTAQRAGIARMGWSYDQSALVCAISHEMDHKGMAHQFFMPAGPLAILPLTGKRSSIVWTETQQAAPAINALDDTAYLDVLRPRFGDFLGGIALAGARYSYPLSLSVANRFIADRVALVGDAAHGVHPIAGQGLNAGIKDVAALAEILVDAQRTGLDIGAPTVLRGYQTWRRFDTATLTAATDGFNRLFSNDNSLIRGIRRLGMGMVQSAPSLRKSFIREAAGLTGTLPRLMQGKSL